MAVTAWVQARVWQAREERALARALARPDPAGSAAPDSSAPVSEEPLDPGVLGKLEMPRVDLSVIVKEGDDPRTLKVAAGHVPGTALPWQRGNVGIAGHRDTFFRPLRNVRKGDEVLLTTPKGKFAYRVDHLYVVRPDQTSVLSPSKEERLTLITCFPFSWAGPAPKRFVVGASRVN